MNLSKHDEASASPSPSSTKPPHVIIQQALLNLHNHCSTFIRHHQNNNNIPNPLTFKTHFDSALSNLRHTAKQAIEAGFSRFHNNNDNPSSKALASSSNSSSRHPPLAQISQQRERNSVGVGMTKEAIEERLAGVPVYALSNSSNEFVLVSGGDSSSSGISMGLFCFKEDDAVALLQQMMSVEPAMREGSQVVAVALNKVVQLKLDGVAFRLIPEVTQVKHALEEKRKIGIKEESFNGVPVFQSKSLILKSQGKKYRPVFFRKEDLEKSLVRASRDQRRLNPSFKEGDIEVAVLEDIVEGMKGAGMSAWEDVVFIPPGFDVSTDPSQK